MKKQFSLILVAVASLLAATGSAQAKVAFLDVKLAMDAHPKTPGALKALANFKKTHFKTMSQKLDQTIKKKLGGKTPAQLSPEQRKELQQLSAAYEDSFDAALNKKDLELTAPIMRDIRAAATAIMKEKGYDAVLDKDALFVGGENITALVSARLKKIKP